MTDPVAIKCAATIEAMLKHDYIAAIAHLRWLDAIEGKWKYHHRYHKATARVEQVFKDEFGGPVWPRHWPPNEQITWQNEVGYYVHRLKVAPLVDDIRAAKAAGLKPRSLIYFLRSKNEHGQKQSSRWEMLLVARMEVEWQEAKRQEAEGAKEAAHRIGYRPEQVELGWVAEARKTLKALKGKVSLTPDERRTIAKIEAIMSRMGLRP